MTEEASKPVFKYHPNLYELDILEHFEGTCECCGRQDDTFYQGMYTTEDVDYLCLDCVASGRAAERFHGHFNTGIPRIDNPEAVDELLHRTPGYVSWQEGDWMACCGDYCAYIGPVGTRELGRPLDSVLELPHRDSELLHLALDPVDEPQPLIVDVVADEEELVVCRPALYLGEQEPR